MAEYVTLRLFLFSLLLMGEGRQETVALLDDPINGGEEDSPLTQREVQSVLNIWKTHNDANKGDSETNHGVPVDPSK